MLLTSLSPGRSNGLYPNRYCGSHLAPTITTRVERSFSFNMAPLSRFAIELNALFNTKRAFSRIDHSGPPNYSIGLGSQPTLSSDTERRTRPWDRKAIPGRG